MARAGPRQEGVLSMNGRRRAWLVIGAVAVVALTAAVVPAAAGGRVFFGVGVGLPFWYPYAYPYPYPYAYPVYSPPVVVQAPPPVYVQREPPPPAPAPIQYWYYCQASQTYYPYVKECPGGWMQVVPQTSPPAPPR
jgi:hypothetical protein